MLKIVFLVKNIPSDFVASAVGLHLTWTAYHGILTSRINPLDSYPSDSLPNAYEPTCSTLRAGNASGYPLGNRPTDSVPQVGRVGLSTIN
jgi:hypothetical protein